MAIIASQAIIAGIFGDQQDRPAAARTSIRHTSKMQEGQIYIPMINRWMFIFSVLLVLAFQTSDRMARPTAWRSRA